MSGNSGPSLINSYFGYLNRQMCTVIAVSPYNKMDPLQITAKAAEGGNTGVRRTRNFCAGN